jgi:small subunit ribosomal protein S17
MAETLTRAVRKEREGVVTSAAMEKTIVVLIERRMRHPQYGKVVKRFKKFYAHDEKNEARQGDRVLIAETRPLSKLKRWRLVKVIARGAAQPPVEVGS